MDGYHLRRSVLQKQENSEFLFKRRGAPFTFDPEGIIKKIREIKENNQGKVPNFNHGVGDPEEDAICIETSQKIVILEGLYILYNEDKWKQITEEMDVCIYVDCSLDLCRERLSKRHCEKWNISTEKANERIEGNDLINAKLILDNL
eukprot:CAMPEP_0206195964 /NCGR_PEP_ID=MMETSP0166-20121206/8159_1 /ASSEMBLY_ACC=CAM_ASM_000260 /TAXON_ID=95228 /ORGANISM="Vannella robusta, Strain DIVA3 518/3/11/1/6" /LENGTH=146 /DNA_ID=CAMNT_0053613335 /DNA_START=128 /DNA_END=564 /DNA_ORIENTATION=+